ncbi:LytR C-terminal domain-containing protein [Streptomyces cavernae]|uniref:LytR C-terminal domain-containing protein n=1 Tax=Streptomyces cavernae TaxID=2259034 RepID=UPI001EE427B3|nr:LytR C-terminal domain-containing protein [Streptomyces cavernae]
MSMLTPPGMGGRYRITGDKYPRMRRPRGRRRLVFAVVAGVAALGLAGWGTLQLIDVFTGGADAATGGPVRGCPTTSPSTKAKAKPTVALPQPGRITVNVLNATARTGLAKDTAAELKKRGFRIGTVGNATKEYDKKVEGPGIVLGGEGAEQGAMPVLATQLAGAELTTDGRTKSTEVDLVLGDGFRALTEKAAAAKALSALANPEPTPAGSASASKKSC